MKKEIRWGILATGGIAHLQTSDLLTNGSQVRAVGSRSMKSADKFADQYAITHRYGTYRELCESSEVDIIYVATPHSFHMEHALMALEGGKHVLVEKAFTLNADQAERIINKAQEKNLFVMEAMWTRFLPSMRRVKQLIREGAIGNLRLIIADHNQYIPMEMAPRLHEPALGGGALLDLGIYPLSLASLLMGPPENISVEGHLTELGVDEMTGMLLSYKDGAMAVLHCGSLTPGSNTAVMVGDKGRIEMDCVWYTQTSFTLYDRQGNIVERYEDTIDGRGMQYQVQEVESCIARGKTESDTMPLSETLEIMRTMDAIRQSAGVIYPIEQ